MSLTGKLVQKVDITCQHKLLHETYKYKLNECAAMAPDKIQSCQLLSGEWGVPGSIIFWHFIHDGKANTAKEIIEAVDDETHKVVFKVIEGEILEAYKTLILTVHIEEAAAAAGIAGIGIGHKQCVVWTIDYEKVNASIPDPTSFLDLLCACTKDFDAHIIKHA